MRALVLIACIGCESATPVAVGDASMAQDAPVALSDLCCVGTVDVAASAPDLQSPDLFIGADFLVTCGGKVCNFAHAGAVCINGVCVLEKCNLGFANCDGLDPDGCEADLSGDPANCGGCRMACSMSHIANVGCAGGVCVGNCTADYGDCNGDKRTDGCETYLIDNHDNCGACGNLCGQGLGCDGKACVACGNINQACCGTKDICYNGTVCMDDRIECVPEAAPPLCHKQTNPMPRIQCNEDGWCPLGTGCWYNKATTLWTCLKC